YSSDGVDFSKIYKQNEVPILSKFFESSEKFKNHDKEKLCLGFQGKYHLQRYTYEKIAKGIRKWLPEVLLRPRELADNTATNLEEKLSIYSREKYKNKGELLSLVPQVLLHSVIRTAYNSQPIPAHLHIDDDNNTTYTNVHIVINRHAPDILVMGFNYFIRDLKEDSLNKIVSDFENLLEQEAFDTKKDKIIEIKDDNYLLSHDIDDILDSNSSLDEHLDRFKFVFFIGFNSHNLDCHKSKMKSNFEDDLKVEIENRFIELIERLLLENEFYSNMNIEVCLYPVPRIDSLLDSVKSCLEA
ncbi:Hachiman antiphage defense system protein HamA, partial [Vibrio splendidus]